MGAARILRPMSDKSFKSCSSMRSAKQTGWVNAPASSRFGGKPLGTLKVSEQIDSLSGLSNALTALDPDEPFPVAALRVPRCKDSGTQRVSLPSGFFDNPFDETLPPELDSIEGG
jgi:hypothetical protein